MFLDVGANIGYHTLFACSRVGAQGRVIAIEPNPDNCRLIQASAKRNGFSNLVLHQIAVADRRRTVSLKVTAGSNGHISLNDPIAGTEAVMLDDLLQNERSVDVVKIDIEGAEPLALRGMAVALKRYRPIIITEFMPIGLQEVSGVDGEAYLKLIRSSGYSLHLLDRQSPVSDEEILDTLFKSEFQHLDIMARPL